MITIRRTRRRAAVILAVLALIASVVPACGGGESGGGKAIIVGQVAEPEKSPDPILDGSLAGYNYYYNVFDQLTALDADGKIEPRLATQWTSSPDFTTWTYTLRDDVKFHDGSALTASDVAFTYDTILKAKDSDNLAYMEQLKAVEALDPTHVKFTLNASFSPWPSITTAISIVPQAVYQKLGSEAFAAAPVGSGPFKFVSWTRGVDYVIEANPDYWGPKPSVDKVTFQTVADENARLNGVQSGSLDIALISPNQVDSLAGNDAVTVATRESNGVTFLGINPASGPLADVKVRQAISKAIDLQAITKGVLAGRAVPNSQLAAPSVTGFDPRLAAAQYDPEAAKKLLAESSYRGEEIPFQYATDGRIPLSTDVAQAIEGYLSTVGIKIKMIGMDQASLSDTIYSTVTVQGLYLNTWAPSTMDGDMPITNLFAGGQNDYAKNPAAASLVKEQRGVSGDARLKVFDELWTMNIATPQIIGLYTPDTAYAVNPKLQWTPRADGEMVLSGVTVK